MRLGEAMRNQTATNQTCGTHPPGRTIQTGPVQLKSRKATVPTDTAPLMHMAPTFSQALTAAQEELHVAGVNDQLMQQKHRCAFHKHCYDVVSTDNNPIYPPLAHLR